MKIVETNTLERNLNECRSRWGNFDTPFCITHKVNLKTLKSEPGKTIEKLKSTKYANTATTN